jgi:hypothetical protein
LGLESDSVILAAAIVYVNVNEPSPSFDTLSSNVFSVKFSIRDQIDNYQRKTYSETVSWWKNREEDLKIKHFLPNKEIDLDVKTGLIALKKYILKNMPATDKSSELFFSRGMLSKFCLNSLSYVADGSVIIPNDKCRETATAIDCLKENAKRGFCPTDKDINYRFATLEEKTVYDAYMLVY